MMHVNRYRNGKHLKTPLNENFFFGVFTHSCGIILIVLNI